jgi:hypothetical protein
MNTYWEGPFGIKVPNTIDCVYAADDKNVTYQDGSTTKMCPNVYLTEEEYKERYAIYNTIDKCYYWHKK